MGGYFSSILKDMKCFPFYNAEKKEEPKTTKSNPVLSSSFGLFDSEFRHSHRESSSQNVSDTSSESRGRSQIPSLSDRPSDLRAFTFSELKAATKNFNRTTKIGEGGFGCVYKATVKTGEDSSKKIDVAVKQLGRRGLQGHKEWVTEVNVLGVAEHKNLVKLVGYCAEDDERGIQRLLVYEYMPNRSVENHLSARSETPLSWAMRLKIAQDAARGLAYLHEEMDFQIIFRDFKSSNILLDEQWNAKLSDFGLARLGPPEGLTHVSTAVVGTMGYAAPEYVQTGRLTSKSDVWSYGVFLYELITGRQKIFVGGLPSSLTEEEFCQYFQDYGNVTDKVIMFDPNTGRPRGFGFITFDSEDAVDRVLHKTFHELKNRIVEVKRALPKEANPAGNNYGGGYRGYGSSDPIRFPQPAFCGYTPYNSYGALNYGYGYGYDPYTFYGGAAGVYMNPSLASIVYGNSLPGATRNQWSSQNLGHGDFYNLNASYGASSSLGASSTRGVILSSTSTSQGHASQNNNQGNGCSMYTENEGPITDSDGNETGDRHTGSAPPNSSSGEATTHANGCTTTTVFDSSTGSPGFPDAVLVSDK